MLPRVRRERTRSLRCPYMGNHRQRLGQASVAERPDVCSRLTSRS
jgi:hypothetical protein